MARRKDNGDQLSLFGGDPRDPAAPAALEASGARRGAVAAADPTPEVEELGQRLPPGVHLGGSTWSFPGWEGLIYDGAYSESKLAREGLAAYARHPLLRGVGIDRTHYQPLPAEELRRYADVVPEGFRFLVKAHEALTLRAYPDRPRYGAERGRTNPRYLDAAYAAEAVVAPFVEGLGAKAGALLFQFAPQDLGGGKAFADALYSFLSALPRGPIYAVELRNRELLTPAYRAALAESGACHCLNVYPRMPPVLAQAELAGTAGGRVGVLRWLLGGEVSYETASRTYAPFNRLVAPDPEARQAIARLLRAAVAAGQPFLATVNNNAEGCAPLSIVELVKEMLADGESRPES